CPMPCRRLADRPIRRGGGFASEEGVPFHPHWEQGFRPSRWRSALCPALGIVQRPDHLRIDFAIGPLPTPTPESTGKQPQLPVASCASQPFHHLAGVITGQPGAFGHALLPRLTPSASDPCPAAPPAPGCPCRPAPGRAGRPPRPGAAA